MSAILREIANGFAIHHPAVIAYAAVIVVAVVVAVKERLP